MNITTPTSRIDTVIKSIKVISQLVWLAIGVIVLLGTLRVYQVIKSGQLTQDIQKMVSGIVSDRITEGAAGAAPTNGEGGLNRGQPQQQQRQ